MRAKKTAKKVISILLISILAISFIPITGLATSGLWTDYKSADLTANNNIFTITSAAELAWFSYKVNTGSTFLGYTIVLAADINLSDHYWVPIGTSLTYAFKGTFEGGNHVITNMKITNTYTYAGLFGYVVGGTLKNTYLSDADVNVTATLAGMLTGFINGGAISNCAVSGNMNVINNGTTAGYAGGFIGGSSGTNSVLSILNCSVTGSISYNNSISPTTYVGGFVGTGSTNPYAYTIRNCYTNCNLSLIGTVSAVGGFCGYDKATISNCYASGTITGSGTYKGGFVGSNQTGSSITNCYWWSGCGVSNAIGTGTAATSLYSLTTAKLQNTGTIGSGTYASYTVVDALNAVAVGITGSKTWHINSGANSGYPIMNYAVVYNSNGSESGTVPVDNGLHPGGTTATVKGNTGNLYKNGYTFIGWNTSADGSGSSYSPGAALSVGTSDITLYAVFQANQRTITFSTDGGSAVASITQDVNTTIDTAPMTVKTGYIFGGWYLDAAFTNPITFPYTITMDATLYARWVLNGVTISFETNGGGSVAPIVQEANTTISTAPVITKTGYTFSGWYSDSACTNHVTFPYTATQDASLYAGWTINQYTVTFNANGGTPVSAITQNYNTTIYTAPVTIKTGQIFEGWYTDAAFTNKVTFPYTNTADTTLYANWTYDLWTYYATAPTLSGMTYTISTASELSWIAAQVNTGTTYSGYTFVLAADIDLSEHFWAPIGTSSINSFRGIFEGGSHLITGLNIVGPHLYAGLFGYVIGGTLRDINLSDCEMNVTGQSFGLLAGFINGGTIQNCTAGGNITVLDNTAGFSAVGGLIGDDMGSSASLIINCSATGNIIYTGISGSISYIGGFIGENWNTSGTSSTITNCFSNCNLYVTNGSNVGGFIGVNVTATIDNCYSIGMITNTGNEYGFAGYLDRGSISNCYWWDGCGTPAPVGSGATVTSLYRLTTAQFQNNVVIGLGVYSNYTIVQALNAEAFCIGGAKYWRTESGLNSDYPVMCTQPTNGIWTDFSTLPAQNGTTFTITTASELAWIADQASRITGAAFGGYTIVLTADIDLSEHYWVPIGSSSTKSFGGTFDGGNHTISGMKIKDYYSNVGLFGYVSNGTIKNIKLDNSDINIVKTGTGTTNFAGLLVGVQTGGTIQNCSVDGNINETNGSTTTSTIGGLAGEILNGIAVLNCTSTGTIIYSWINTTLSTIGGFTGITTNPQTPYPTVKNCYVNCNIAISGTTTPRVGGFSGYNLGTVSNCYSAGKIESISSTTKGGFIGYNYTGSSITNCYWWSGCGVTAAIGSGTAATSLYSLTTAKLQNTGTIGSGTYASSTIIQALNAVAAGITNSKSWTAASGLNNGYPVFSDQANCTISYDPNGATSGSVPADSNTVSNGTVVTVAGNTGELEKQGYTFSGWNTAANGSGTNYEADETFTITSNTTLYARWTINSYTISIEENGGSSVTDINQDYNTTINSVPISIKNGFIFDGWYTDSQLTNKVAFPYTVQEDVTFYAKWKEGLHFVKSTYSVSIPSAGNRTITISTTGKDADGNPINPAGVTYALETPYTGVTINSQTGVITITSTVSVGSVNVIASYEEQTCTTVLSIEETEVSTLSLSVHTNNIYYVGLTANNIPSFDGVTYTVTYDAAVLELIDLCAYTWAKDVSVGVIAGTGITIIALSPGEIQFSIDKTIANNYQWTGILNIFAFRALTTGSTVINII